MKINKTITFVRRYRLHVHFSRAVKEGNIERVKLLLDDEEEYFINKEDNDRSTPLI